MMKLKTLFVLTSVTMLSGSVNAANVYATDGTLVDIGGRVETRMDHHKNSKEEQKFKDSSRARLNVTVSQEVTPDINVKGFVENEFTKSGRSLRYLNLGIADQNNTFQYGKTSGSLGIITDYTDILNTFGGEAGNKSVTANRASNQLLYKGNFDRLVLKANVNLGGDDVKVNEKKVAEVDNGFGAAATFDIGGGLNIGAGIASESHTQNQKDSENILLGAGWSISDMYFGGLFVKGEKVGDDFDGYEVAGSYLLTDQLSLAATYTTVDFDKKPDDDERAAIDIGYQVLPNLSVYAGYGQQFTLEEDSYARIGAKLTI